MESLPPENSSTGFSNSEATSLMMWMASARVELLSGVGHDFLVKLVEMTSFICITGYETRDGLPCQRSDRAGNCQATTPQVIDPATALGQTSQP